MGVETIRINFILATTVIVIANAVITNAVVISTISTAAIAVRFCSNYYD